MGVLISSYQPGASTRGGIDPAVRDVGGRETATRSELT